MLKWSLIVGMVVGQVVGPAQAEITVRVEGRSRITSITATASYFDRGRESTEEGRLSFHSGPARIPRLVITAAGILVSTVVGAAIQRPAIGAAVGPIVSLVGAGIGFGGCVSTLDTT
jgi:hypothetical protein